MNRTDSRPRTRSLLLALAVTIGIVVPVLSDSAVSAARTIHVAPWGNDSGSGSSGSPYGTIEHAVRQARSGDTISLRGGTYNESVQIYNKRVMIKSADGERAVLDGAVPVTGFRKSGGDWYANNWKKQFSRTQGPMVSSAQPEAAYPDQVFLNGVPLRQVLKRWKVVPGTFYHDTAGDRIWIGDNPTGKTVEASNLSWALYFNRANGSSLRDVTIRRYATEGADMGAVRAYANNLVLSGVTIELNAFSGVSAMGQNIVIRDSRFIDNGYLGVHAHQVDTFVVERSAVLGNNKAGFDAWHAAGGLKVTEGWGITVRDSDVSRNDGPGIWTDIDTRYVTVARNMVEGNGRSGIQIELTQNVNVVSNVTLDNGEAGIWVLESPDVAVYHNASYRNETELRVLEGPRRDLRNIVIRNNILGEGRADQQALLMVDDWTENRSFEQMGVTSNYNAFWLPVSSPTDYISRWARWPQNLALNRNLAQSRNSVGQEMNSVITTVETNPFIRNAATGDYRGQSHLRRGAPVRGSMASALGVASGTRLRIGPVAPVVRR